MKRSKIILFITTLCISSCLVAVDSKRESPKPIGNEYFLEENDKFFVENELCENFLNVLNSENPEDLRNDIFLEKIASYENFEPLFFELIEDGESKYENYPLEKIRFLYSSIGWSSEAIKQKIEDFKRYKEARGGFYYYLTKYKAIDEKELPILVFVSKKLSDAGVRPEFDYIVLDSDMRSPKKDLYLKPGVMRSSFSGQLFLYKGKLYQLNFLIMSAPWVSEIYKNRSLCQYEKTEKDPNK